LSKRVRLARVTGGLDLPRGPDAKHRIRVLSRWLDEGAVIELELPRNLACAKCDGGGCDACGRSGAVTLRGRDEPPEIVQVTLPRRGDSAELAGSGRGVVLRVPERGGLANDDGLARGNLMLTVLVAAKEDPGVVRIERAALVEPEAKRAAVVRPPARPEARKSRVVLVVAILVVLWILGLIFLRVTGRG
jgi:hypothetical protein